ncbi:MAG: LysR family transcriptional regulator [Lachnospiraceae bacterium]|jgi:DNA-binding transcriptional LysR family regulator|nr:LysR family transcriptional regulator [Lachnospiraceae bacterium]
MDEKQLEYFSVLCETKNMTKAAGRLYISRTGLSLSMKKLEKELGVPLFLRKNGGVELTEYGAVFYQAVSAQRQIMSDCQKKLTDMKTAATEVIRIGALANTLVPEYIRHIFLFEQICPSVTVEIVDNGTLSYFDALKKGSLDIAFAVCPPQNLRLCSTRILDCEQVLLINKEHPLAARDSVDFTCDLHGETLLEAESRMDTHLELLLSFGIRRKHVAGDCRILQEMLRQGKGCIVTLSSLAPLYASEGVAVLPVKNIPDSLDLNAYLVYRPDSGRNILRLVEHISGFRASLP